MKQTPHFCMKMLVIFCLILAGTVTIFSLAFGEEFRYDSHKKRDAFIAPDAGGVIAGKFSQGELRLEGVIIDRKGGSYAIVNGDVVKEGSEFNGYLLKKVDPNRVTFEKNGEPVEIILREDDELLEKSMKS